MLKYDTIIIGAGLGGLTAGAYLAKNKKKVIIIEQHHKAGGFATNFKRKGFTFDVSLHNLGPVKENYNLNKILNDLEIYKKVEFLKLENSRRIIFPELEITVKSGIDAFINQLTSKFPSEEKGIKSLFKVFRDIHAEFSEIERADVPIEKIEEAFPLLPIKFPMLVKLVDKSLSELLEEYLKDERLKGIVSYLWWFYGLPPQRLASILYSVPSVN